MHTDRKTLKPLKIGELTVEKPSGRMQSYCNKKAYSQGKRNS